MDIVYRHGRVAAAVVQSEMPDPPSNSAVRAMLAILVNRGQLKIEQEGPRYLYLPTHARSAVGRSAMKKVLETFFDGSVEDAVAAILDTRKDRLTAKEASRLKELIEQTRKEGR